MGNKLCHLAKLGGGVDVGRGYLFSLGQQAGYIVCIFDAGADVFLGAQSASSAEGAMLLRNRNYYIPEILLAWR